MGFASHCKPAVPNEFDRWDGGWISQDQAKRVDVRSPLSFIPSLFSKGQGSFRGHGRPLPPDLGPFGKHNWGTRVCWDSVSRLFPAFQKKQLSGKGRERLGTDLARISWGEEGRRGAGRPGGGPGTPGGAAAVLPEWRAAAGCGSRLPLTDDQERCSW